MAAIEVGRKVIKTKGRKAGKAFEVVKVVDKTFVEIKDDKGVVKKSNIMHLEPLV